MTMTTSDKFQRHSFKVAFKLTAKSVRSHILTFGIFENRIAGLGSCEDSIIGARAGVGAAGAGTFCPEPEPEPEPPISFTRSRSRSRSRNAAPEPDAGVGAGMLPRSRSRSRSRPKMSRLRIPGVGPYLRVVEGNWKLTATACGIAVRTSIGVCRI